MINSPNNRIITASQSTESYTATIIKVQWEGKQNLHQKRNVITATKRNEPELATAWISEWINVFFKSIEFWHTSFPWPSTMKIYSDTTISNNAHTYTYTQHNYYQNSIWNSSRFQILAILNSFNQMFLFPSFNHESHQLCALLL